jgi:predicted esterase
VGGFGPNAAKLPAGYDSKKQRYQLYAPPVSESKKARPLVIFISPADQPMGWTAWRKVCQENKVLFCSPYGAGNACPAGQRTRIVLDMLDDVRRQYRIDPDRTYISGFSGGGRMACAIGFALPEWFGGIAPVCGTNPITGPTYLRHRLGERLSVAFITGAKDSNRKENEEYMYPYFQELEIRTRLWVVPGLGHAVPSATTIDQVFAWLEQDLDRRRGDAKAHAQLAMGADDTPSPEAQATKYLQAAQVDLKDADRVWKGVALLQGVVARWSKTAAAQEARAKLKSILDDAKVLGAVSVQGAEDEQKFLTAQAKALERFGDTQKAVQAWELLAHSQPDTPAGKNAASQVQRLRRK